MLKRIDAAIDGVTMYRLTLYVLLGLLGVASRWATFGLLPFSPLSMLLSAAFLVAICWAMNTLLAKFLSVPTNGESTLITALILALIIDPAQSFDGYQFLGWAAILAISSKYILSIKNKHIFNPAVIAVVITSFALGESASWWIATAAMAPATLVGSLLIVRKVRQEEMAAWFVAAALVMMCAVSVLMGLSHPAGGGAAGDRRAAHLRRRRDADRAVDCAADAQPEALLRAADRRSCSCHSCTSARSTRRQSWRWRWATSFPGSLAPSSG